MRRVLFIFTLFIKHLVWNSSVAQELQIKKHPLFINTSLSTIVNENYFVSPSFSFGVGIIRFNQHYLGINFSRYNLQGLTNLTSFYYDARIGTHPSANYHGYYTVFDMHLKYRCYSTGLFYAKLHQFKSRKALFYASINIMTVIPIALFEITPSDYYLVSSKPSLDLLLKYNLFSKREKRTYFRISPTFRYNYISNINVYVAPNQDPWDHVTKINSYNKHLFLFGLSFELMNVYKKQKITSTQY
jgi:hypothetical protein